MEPSSPSVTGTGRTFRFIRLIARGGFGEVYVAEMSSGDGFSKTVSIKLMRNDVNDPEQAQRMRDEARLLGMLRHPNIVQAEDLLTVAGRPAVVMEFIPGADVAMLLPEKKNPGPIPPRVPAQVIRQVALALDAALNRPSMLTGKPLGVLHRDIKPANIRVTPDGEVKVLDFGIARADNMAREAKTTDYQLGTLPYMAPEVLAGTQSAHASDIYALGVTFYEFVGRKRFGWAGESEDTHAYQLGGRLADLELGPWGEQASVLVDLLKRMLAFEAEARPTAREVADECRKLEDALSGARLDEWIHGALENIKETSPSEEQGSLVGKVLAADTQQSQKIPLDSSDEAIDGDLETIAVPTGKQSPADSDEPTIALETGARQSSSLESEPSRPPWASIGIIVLVAAGVFIMQARTNNTSPVPTQPVDMTAPGEPTPPESPAIDESVDPKEPLETAASQEKPQDAEPAKKEAPATKAPAERPSTKAKEPAPATPAVAVPLPQKASAPPEPTVRPTPVDRSPLPVRIASVPFGVKVEVDGKDVGRTPVRGLELSPGSHTLVFIDEDKRTEKEIKVLSGARNLWTFRRADGSIE